MLLDRTGVIIRRATIEDAEEILDLQKLAYKSEAEIYNDYTIPPLTQTLEEMRLEFENWTFLKALAVGKIIGSVRACMHQETCMIGRLIVHPDFQNQGIGTMLMNEIERCFLPQSIRFELFTGHRSKRNIHLYRKLGYSEFKDERVTEDLTLVYMEKYARE
ncbi:MAG TPA: GNAT family N-acetyltransferase [Methanosarcinales archaeon]|nr:GNAT family N-acetyltransferase [Methanosarcinales archaeon]